MKLLILSLILFICSLCTACSDSNKENPTPPEPPITPGEIGVVLVSTIPDSIVPGEEIEIIFKVVQDKQTENFTFSIDTTGSFDMTVNSYPYKNVTTIIPDKENSIKLIASKEGVCKFTLNISNEKKSAKKEIAFKSVSRAITMTFSEIPDSVSVHALTSFTFKVNGQIGTEYAVSIDTIIPKFIYVNTVTGVFTVPDGGRRGVNLSINNKPLEKFNIVPGTEYAFNFSDPQAVGDYKLIFNLTDKYGKVTKVEKMIRAYSPAMILKFYEVDPWIELGFNRDTYYKNLNTRFEYTQLPPYFTTKIVDTIYTVVKDFVGRPGVFTVPGRGMVLYVAQENGNKFFLPGIYDSKLEATALRAEFDNNDGTAKSGFQSGFHGTDFNTNGAPIGVGKASTYVFDIFDFWGKKSTITMTIVVLPYGSEMPYPDNVWLRRYDWSTHVDPIK